MPTKRVVTQVFKNRNYSYEDTDENMQNYMVPSPQMMHGHHGMGMDYGYHSPGGARRYSLPPAPYNDERRRYDDQRNDQHQKQGYDTNSLPRNMDKKRHRARSHSKNRNRKQNNPNAQQQIRNDRRRSMDNFMYNPGRRNASRDPSPHVWEATNNPAGYASNWRGPSREHSPMYRGMTEYGGYGPGPGYGYRGPPRSREPSPGYQSPVYSPQYEYDNPWGYYSGRRPPSREPSPHYGDSGGYMPRTSSRRPPSRDPSPAQYTRDKPPRGMRKPSSRPSSRDPSPNYGDFGYVRTILFDRRPNKEHMPYMEPPYCDNYNSNRPNSASLESPRKKPDHRGKEKKR